MQITDLEKDFLRVGYTVATEANFLVIFDTILDACMRYTRADGGTLYMVDDEEGRLVHLLDLNRTLDADEKHSADQADMELAEDRDTNIFTYAYHKREVLNIEDIYAEERFDTRFIREFDKKNEYRTRSMLVSPIHVVGKPVLGVVSLYNSTDHDGNVISFDKDCENIVRSLTSQMANSLTNMILIQDMDEQLGSFVKSLTTAIDAKTPYNANHTRHVEQYCMQVVDFINDNHTRGNLDIYITDNDREQLSMAALLHDIGKIITPREMMNKSTRLGVTGLERLWDKLERIRLLKRIDFLEGRLEESVWAAEDKELMSFLEDLDRLNVEDSLSPEDLAWVDAMSAREYRTTEGEVIPYLDYQEQKSLHIMKGTLTEEEREVVEQHVVYTDRLLADIRFTDKYNKVRSIAANHHEMLDGSGYPRGLRGDQLDFLTRILTVCDIYDSLTADDRPYKARIDEESAIGILKGMAMDGKLDPQVVNIVAECMQPGTK
ncbi:MAG: GAF domain-containing protein [Lachnospiraceae bacterium]|nr:GAF domain-containing protein [Lachnospiraceae bacterium]